MQWRRLAALCTTLLAIAPLRPALAQSEAPPPTLAAQPFDAGALEARFVDDDLVLGKLDAPVTVVEYLSGACPYCAAFDRDVFPYVAQNYIATGKVRYVIREILTAPVSLAASGFLLARCAGESRYLSVIEFMFRNRDRLLAATNARQVVLDIGGAGGLDEAASARCLDDEAALEKLNDRVQAALEAGVEGTPTFVFDGKMLKPGQRLGRTVYGGGGLTASQFDSAFQLTSGISKK